MNARGLSHGYINVSMAAIFHLTYMNDILLNKRKISKFQGERKKMNRDRAYTLEEIKLLADTGDFRFRALVCLEYGKLRKKYIGPQYDKTWKKHLKKRSALIK